MAVRLGVVYSYTAVILGFNAADTPEYWQFRTARVPSTHSISAISAGTGNIPDTHSTEYFQYSQCTGRVK